jgi:hypothetical protein
MAHRGEKCVAGEFGGSSDGRTVGVWEFGSLVGVLATTVTHIQNRSSEKSGG